MENVGTIITCLIVLLGTLSSARVIEIKSDDDGVYLDSEENEFDSFYKTFLEYFKPPTVGHFATHTLCLRHKRQFEDAMANKLSSMNEAFVKDFVRKLCEKRPHTMLKLWVSELFDSDSNGFIDDHEKHAFLDHNYSD